VACVRGALEVAADRNSDSEEIMSSRVDHCDCGKQNGTNPKCERCSFIAEIDRLRAELSRLLGVVGAQEDFDSILRVLAGK